jgi:hypothetical protein
VALAAAFLGYAIYFLEIKKWRYYWPTIILTLLIREDVPIYLFALGVYGFLIKKERWVGLSTAVISLVYFYLIFNLFMPWLGNQAAFTGNSVGNRGVNALIIETLFTSPLDFLKTFVYPLIKLRNILLTAFSFGFLPFASPLYWIMAPFTFLRYFAGDSVKFSLRLHYAASLTPILAFSTISVLSKIKSRRLAYGLIILAVVGTFYTNRPGLDPHYLSPPLVLIFKRSFYVLPPRNNDYDTMLALIPATASVSAQVPLLAHLINRDQIYRFPANYQDADYIALTFTESFYPMTFEDMVKIKNELLADPAYEQLYLSYAGAVLKKIR